MFFSSPFRCSVGFRPGYWWWQLIWIWWTTSEFIFSYVMDHYSTARLTNHQFSVWQRPADFDVKSPGLDTVQSNNIIWVFRREADSASQILQLLQQQTWGAFHKFIFVARKTHILGCKVPAGFRQLYMWKGFSSFSPPYSSSHVVPHPA